MLEFLRLLLNVLVGLLRDRQSLVVENLLLRHQLAVALRSRPRSKLQTQDKLLWVCARQFCPIWRHHLVLVRPDTVIGWHRQVWRLLWRWRSCSRGGRPRLAAEVRELIATLSRENPLWGTERIRGELLKLGMAVSNPSIRRHGWQGPVRPSSQTWRSFLANHQPEIWAADLFTVPTLTFRALSALVFIAHDRRQLVPVHITAHANAVAERVSGTLRRECLDHLIVLNEWHLHAILREFVAYSTAERPHRTLGLEPPVPTIRADRGPIRSRSVLGGLHQVYERTG